MIACRRSWSIRCPLLVCGPSPHLCCLNCAVPNLRGLCFCLSGLLLSLPGTICCDLTVCPVCFLYVLYLSPSARFLFVLSHYSCPCLRCVTCPLIVVVVSCPGWHPTLIYMVDCPIVLPLIVTVLVFLPLPRSPFPVSWSCFVLFCCALSSVLVCLSCRSFNIVCVLYLIYLYCLSVCLLSRC